MSITSSAHCEVLVFGPEPSRMAHALPCVSHAAPPRTGPRAGMAVHAVADGRTPPPRQCTPEHGIDPRCGPNFEIRSPVTVPHTESRARQTPTTPSAPKKCATSGG
jgi:hypothetical protein